MTTKVSLMCDSFFLLRGIKLKIELRKRQERCWGREDGNSIHMTWVFKRGYADGEATRSKQMGERGESRISNNSKMIPENVIRKYNILCPNYIDQSRRLRKIKFYILRHSDWRYTTMWSLMTILAEYKTEP